MEVRIIIIKNEIEIFQEKGEEGKGRRSREGKEKEPAGMLRSSATYLKVKGVGLEKQISFLSFFFLFLSFSFFFFLFLLFFLFFLLFFFFSFLTNLTQKK